jgi:multiple sugar transport system substrate-binding protein
MKKIVSAILAALMVFSFTACSKSNPGTASGTARTTVNFWYLWTGDEAKTIEKIVTAYNGSQSKYTVVGLSTPDQQKIVTSISGGKGPDISDCFGSSMVKYASDGIAMPLDDLMSKNSVTSDDYVKQAFEQQQYNGKTYALPISMNIFALYYNKDLLKASGITDAPKTAEELFQMSEKTTKVSGGKVTQLGSPFVTNSYWYSCMALAFGTDFGKSDGSTLTPDNAGFKTALQFEESQVKKFGSGLNNFVTSGVAKQYTAQDPFLAGTQVFRIDGPWFYKMAQDAKINFGITDIPGSSSTGGSGYTILDTSNFFIPSNAKNADGAFDFMKYITDGDGAKMFVTLKGDLPAKKALTTDSSITGISESFKVYLDIVSKDHMYVMPQSEKATKYGEDLTATVDSVITGKSASDALNKLVSQVKAYS